MDYELHCGDCLDILPTLAAGSVDAVVTDPPYLTAESGVRIGGNGGVAKTFVNSTVIGMPWGYSLDWIAACAEPGWPCTRIRPGSASTPSCRCWLSSMPM